MTGGFLPPPAVFRYLINSADCACQISLNSNATETAVRPLWAIISHHTRVSKLAGESCLTLKKYIHIHPLNRSYY